MKSNVEINNELYNVYVTLREKQMSDKLIEKNMKEYLERKNYSKWDIAKLNKYCNLDEANTDLELLVFKLMLIYDEIFEKEKINDEIEKEKSIENIKGAKNAFLYQIVGSAVIVVIIYFVLTKINSNSDSSSNLFLALALFGYVFVALTTGIGCFGFVILLFVSAFFTPLMYIIVIGGWVYLIYLIYGYIYIASRHGLNEANQIYKSEQEKMLIDESINNIENKYLVVFCDNVQEDIIIPNNFTWKDVTDLIVKLYYDKKIDYLIRKSDWKQINSEDDWECIDVIGKTKYLNVNKENNDLANEEKDIENIGQNHKNDSIIENTVNDGSKKGKSNIGIIAFFLVLVVGAVIAFVLLYRDGRITFKNEKDLRGWQKTLTGKWKYYDESGNLFKDGCYDINGQAYFFDDNGIMEQNTWVDFLNERFYVDNDGYILTDQWIGNYYVGSDGKMLKDTMTPDGKKVGKDGKLIVSN